MTVTDKITIKTMEWFDIEVDGRKVSVKILKPCMLNMFKGKDGEPTLFRVTPAFCDPMDISRFKLYTFRELERYGIFERRKQK